MRQLRDIVTTILIAVVIFVALQLTVGSFKVFGQSMMPNVENGDYILVNKISYLFHDPHRGQVIVFRHPNNQKIDLIKRVIGLPGDTVDIKNGKLFVNNIELKENYIMQPPAYEYHQSAIPADHYLVLGDNRNNSADSHNGWTVPRDNIIGEAWLNYWPISHWETIKQYTPSPASK